MEAIARLEAIEQIRHLKARYLRLMDTKQWAELATVFTSDLKVLTPDGRVWLSGGLAYAHSLQSSLEQAVSFHQGLSAEITVEDAHHASAIWAMCDHITWHTAHPREGWKAIAGQGHYHETYRIEEGHWRIATLTLTRVQLKIEWPDGSVSYA